MAKKVLVLLAIIPLLLLPGGCWDRRETEDLLLVDSIVFGKPNTGDTDNRYPSHPGPLPAAESRWEQAAKKALHRLRPVGSKLYGTTLEELTKIFNPLAQVCIPCP